MKTPLVITVEYETGEIIDPHAIALQVEMQLKGASNACVWVAGDFVKDCDEANPASTAVAVVRVLDQALGASV